MPIVKEIRVKESAKEAGFRAPRKDRLLRELVHDPYQSKSKLPDPTVCPGCGGVYHEGRWTWMGQPARAHVALCPACRRIRDGYPAGYLTMRGPFLQAHKQEILNVARNQEARARAEHPLQRIMAIEEQADGVLITTTDPHLARGIGEALYRAYQGVLEFRYTEEGSLLRVRWER